MPQTRTLTVSCTRMALGTPGIGWVAFIALCVLSGGSPLCAADRVDIPLFQAAVDAIAAQDSQKELLFRLPENIAFEPGSELRLSLRSTGILPNGQFSVSLSFNDQPLATPRRAVQAAAPSEVIHLIASVSEGLMLPSWNRLTVTIVPPAGITRDALRGSTFLLRRSECVLSLSYSRLPLFPEFARFPATFVEEKLLHSDTIRSSPLLTIALPLLLRDVHLRACAVLGARLGQLGYLADADYAIVRTNLNSWNAPNRNWIIIGRWDEISGFDPATNCAVSRPLRFGEGVLAECITGTGAAAHRGLLITGADDSGLEKASLTLGSSEALADIAPSPAIITTFPQVAPRSIERFKSTPSFRDVGADVRNLSQAASLLIPDPILDRLAFVVPSHASLEELRMFINLAVYAGSRIPEAPILRPEACGYDTDQPANFSQVHGKTAILLGSARQWKSALPKGDSLPIEFRDPASSDVYMQGRKYPLSEFDPSLSFLQLVPSRWSRGNVMLVAGGWETFATPTVKWMITDPEAPSRVYGDVCAADANGRIAIYEIVHPSVESLGERIKTMIPSDLTIEETNQRLSKRTALARRSHLINDTVFYACGALLVTLVLLRLALVADRRRSRTRAIHTQGSVAASP